MTFGSGKRERFRPHYVLEELKAKIAAGEHYATKRVGAVLSRHGWDESDIEDCVANLTSSDFFKSQAHTKRDGVWLDIYKPTYEGERLYVKFVIDEDGCTIVVLDFCEDGEIH
ncbi:MAG: type II toxin-antitoxin system MqsR family toxin [Actinomycetota bacterium]|nr:type II toxin-antitoxin system MqsR family toxin [Actinomycetota bacterium]